MERLKVLLLLSLVCCSAVAGDNSSDVQPQPDNGIPPGPSDNPFKSTKAKTTTVLPITTTSQIPITTFKPKTTTSVAPNTTTEAPTTVKPNTTTTTTVAPTTVKPNTTTVAPTTIKPNTTTSAPITTAKPTPAPVPAPGHWIVNYTSTNRTCLVLNAQVQIDIPYKAGNVSKLYKVDVPTAAEFSGACGNVTNILNLQFGHPQNNVTFIFTKKVNDSSRFELSHVLVSLNVTVPGDQVPIVRSYNHTKDEFVTPVTRSYKCAQEQSLNLLGNVGNATLILSHLQAQAFRNATNTNFDSALDCVNGETPDVVPIAVGCALAALVIIVLVAYLVGRRRSQARGYLSM